MDLAQRSFTPLGLLLAGAYLLIALKIIIGSGYGDWFAWTKPGAHLFKSFYGRNNGHVRFFAPPLFLLNALALWTLGFVLTRTLRLETWAGALTAFYLLPGLWAALRAVLGPAGFFGRDFGLFIYCAPGSFLLEQLLKAFWGKVLLYPSLLAANAAAIYGAARLAAALFRRTAA